MILVVDDHRDSAHLLVRLLKHTGYHAAAVQCATDAMKIVRRAKPALIILDCHMPEFDGFMMLWTLRGDPSLADIPVVMFSAGDEADRERSLELGARDFIRKGSLDWARLMEVVTQFVEPPKRIPM